jgi:hypothetical protein
MANIHLIPTDKPSRLWINNLLQGQLELSKEVLIGSNTAQNIYITSDEEIKVNDAVIDLETNHVFISKGKMLCNDFIKKVILTDNKDLIKDGVQAIDDTFLEWFIKNPSCEKVETDLIPVNYFGFKTTVDSRGFDKFIYKIIIPQEKDEQTDKNGKPLTCWGGLKESKQETIEEAAKRAVKSGLFKDETLFIAGSKFQAKRSYTEIGIMEIELRHTKTLLASCEKALEDRDKQAERMYSDMEEYSAFVLKSYKEGLPLLLAKEWFEQFKKK